MITNLFIFQNRIDTVKTRLQGQPYPPKYKNFPHTFKTLVKQEGIARGLYAGVIPALFGSGRLRFISI